MCAEVTEPGDEEDEPEEPLDTFFQTRRIRAKEEYARTFPMEKGDELICSISADDYVDISICTAKDYQKWLDGEEDLIEYDVSEEDVRHCDLQTFVAPRNGKFVLVVMNDNEEDVDVTFDAAVWAAEEEEDEEG